MRYELYKIFGNLKVVAIVFAMIVLSFVMATRIDTVMFEGFATDIYRYYIDILKGEYTQEKYDYVFQEYTRMKAHIANSELYDEQYKNNLISASKYRELSKEVSLAKGRIKTFEYIVSKTEYYAECEDTPSYFYDIDVNDYIVNMSVNTPLMISLILIISALFIEDYASNTVSMVRSSRDGQKYLLYRRFKIVVILAVVFSVIFYIGEFMIKYLYLDLGELNSNISSLMSMESSGFNGTIMEYLLLSIVIRIVYTVLLSFVVSIIATMTHRYMLTFAVSSLIIYLPCIV